MTGRDLLSGLLKCGVCGRPYSGQGAKSGQFAYYICGTLFREGAGTRSARYLNAPRVEDFVVEKVLDFVQFGGDQGDRNLTRVPDHSSLSVRPRNTWVKMSVSLTDWGSPWNATRPLSST